MNIHHLSTQLEITFWSMAIPMMSRSRLLARAIQTAYDLKLHRFTLPAILLVGGAMSLVIGFLTGLIFGG
jgi:hypothetical protein